MNPAIEVWHVNRFARCGACRQDWTLREEIWAPGMSCPNCGTVITEGAFFRHYQAVRRIDVGGLGEVMEAIDSVSGRTVAIKTLRHELFHNPTFLAQFAREAITLANLAHPNIVEVYEFFQDRGIHLLAMEYLDHGTLLSRVRREGPLPERDLLRIGIDAVRGLAAALAKGVLHHDIKPANILFDAHGRAKLVDFGLALPIDQALAATGGNWGSPYYVPPERIENLPEDFRGDIYSLGVALFHAASGRTPFQATSASTMAWKHLKAQHVSVKTFARHLSEPTAALINTCMERRPGDRFQSYFDLLDAMESAEKKLLFRPPPKPAPAPDIIGASAESSWTLRWIGLGFATVLLLSLATLLLPKWFHSAPIDAPTEIFAPDEAGVPEEAPGSDPAMARAPTPEPATGAITLGPGFVSRRGGDTHERLNIDRNQVVILQPGTYNVREFSFVSTSGNIWAVPFLAVGEERGRYRVIWRGESAVGSVVSGETVQSEQSGSITLAKPTKIFVGFWTEGGGGVAFQSGSGMTAHDDDFLPPETDDTLADFSHPALNRTYSFTLTLAAHPQK